MGWDHGVGVTALGIDRFEIIKGPSSLLYGSDAIGGVLYFVEAQYAKKNTSKSFIETSFESNSLSNNTSIGKQFTKKIQSLIFFMDLLSMLIIHCLMALEFLILGLYRRHLKLPMDIIKIDGRLMFDIIFQNP